MLLSPVICVCLYVAFCGISLNFVIDMPLLVLASYAVLVAWHHRSSAKEPSTSPLFLYMGLYLLMTGVSILFSEDVGRSILLSASLLPPILAFLLIAEYLGGHKDIRLIYLTFAIVSFGLSAVLLAAVVTGKVADPFVWVSTAGSPLLVVKNDVTFVAVIAPLSLALIYLKPRSISGLVALASLMSGIVVVGFFQSRTALFTMIVSIICFFLFMKPRRGLTFGLATLVIVVGIDSLMGFPLLERFIHHWDGSGRIPLWISAWEMFLDAPLTGHGPHTFVQLYSSYLQNISLPSWLPADSRIVPWPHNLYLEVLAEEGILGFASFLFLLTGGLLAGLRFRRIVSTEARILGYGALASLVAFCFASLFELTFLRQWVALVLFIMLGVIARISFKYQKTEVSHG